MKDRKSLLRTILTIVLFGAVWGLLEATVGYILHWMPAMISGAVMVPIGTALIYAAYRNTNMRTAILFAGLLAAGIKAINFAMPLPGGNIMKVLNPMISILIETAVVYAASFMFDRKTSPIKSTLLQVGTLAIVIVGWRVLFLANQGINYAITGNLPGQLQSAQSALSFVFYNGLFEFLILGVIYAVYRVVSYFLAKREVRVAGPDWLVYVLSPLALVGAVLAVVLL